MDFEWEEVDGQRVAVETEEKVERSLKKMKEIIQKVKDKYNLQDDEQDSSSTTSSFSESVLENQDTETSKEKKKKKKKKGKEEKKEIEEESTATEQESESEVIFDATKDAMPPADFRDDKFLLKFLRASKFDEERAVAQMLRYWHFRSIYLGLKDRKILKTHLNQELFEQGYYFSPNIRDIHGRRVCYIRPEYINTSKYSREDYLRIMTYVLEQITEDVEVQRKGHVLLNDAGEAGMSSIDYNLSVAFVKIAQGLFPIRLSKIMVINQGIVFQAVFTLISPFLSRKMKERVQLIGYEHEKLTQFFDKDNILQKYGGNAIANPLDFE